ncbi:MAG: PssE/Cps14G family polysaccharide biosynthesis glycosyltransferase [Muricoprocola sp.]
MIFLTLGSQKFPFNRLLKEVDELILTGKITEPVFAQIGYSDYEPKYYKYKHFLDREEFHKMQSEADIVITHGGTGAIIGALKMGKKVIAIPRDVQFGEHVDNHQFQLVKEFEKQNIIAACYDTKNLGSVYENLSSVNMKPFRSERMAIINSIEEYLNQT